MRISGKSCFPTAASLYIPGESGGSRDTDADTVTGGKPDIHRRKKPVPKGILFGTGFFYAIISYISPFVNSFFSKI